MYYFDYISVLMFLALLSTESTSSFFELVIFGDWLLLNSSLFLLCFSLRICNCLSLFSVCCLRLPVAKLLLDGNIPRFFCWFLVGSSAWSFSLIVSVGCRFVSLCFRNGTLTELSFTTFSRTCVVVLRYLQQSLLASSVDCALNN